MVKAYLAAQGLGNGMCHVMSLCGSEGRGCAFLIYVRTSFLIPQLGREVLDLALKAVKPGVTTDELDRIVHEVRTCMYVCSMYVHRCLCFV